MPFSTTDLDWMFDIAEPISSTPHEMFVSKMREHVAANGDPNPGQRLIMDCGYQLGRALSSRRSGVVQMPDAQWAEVESLGTLRKSPRVRPSGNDEFMAKLHEHVLENKGDPNPPANFKMSCGFKLGQRIADRRKGHANMSDAEWAEVKKLGTLRKLPTANETFAEKMRAHVDLGGSPNPPESCKTPCGYKLGKALAHRRAGATKMSDAEWAEVEKLGTLRDRNARSQGANL